MITRARARSSPAGRRRLEWWKMAETRITASKTSTDEKGKPNSRMIEARARAESSTSPK